MTRFKELCLDVTGDPAVLGEFWSAATGVPYVRGSDPDDPGGTWRYDVARTTDVTASTPTWTRTPADDGAIVHVGDVCMRGIDCETGGNRNLGDFTSAVVDSDGCAILAYSDDHLDPEWDNRVLRQTGGCF